MGKRGKKGQLKISFGMIFSIMLIIFFLAFAFYGIQKFLDMKNNVQIKQFEEHLTDDVQQMRMSEYGENQKSYLVPNKVQSVCFKNPNEVKIMYERKMDKFTLDDTDFGINDDGKDYFCVEPVNNRVKFTISKEYNSPYVKISK